MRRMAKTIAMAMETITRPTGVMKVRPTIRPFVPCVPLSCGQFLATVMFSNGTPMLLAGDEFGRTQQGNNNAYCQDTPVSWLDWELAASPEGRALTAFTARLIRLRHAHPIFTAQSFCMARRNFRRVSRYRLVRRAGWEVIPRRLERSGAPDIDPAPRLAQQRWCGSRC